MNEGFTAIYNILIFHILLVSLHPFDFYSFVRHKRG